MPLSQLPVIEESLGDALRRARSAIGLLGDSLIPPTPARFAVAYAHQAGLNTDLSLAVNRLVSHDRLTAGAIDELYVQFFASDADRTELNYASQKIQATVGDVATRMNAARERNDGFVHDLQGFSTALSKGKVTQSQAEALLETTLDINRDHEQLRERLNFTLRELETLRGHLDRLEKQAKVDALTGIGNRALFDRQLRAAVAQAKRDQSPLCLLMIDIDHFKRFNDVYGHQMGDQVLKLVARQLASVGDETAEAARYGGEEFALILNQCDLGEAAQLAEHLRRKVETKKVVNRRTGETLGQVTMSIGVARFRPGESAAELVHRADEAMYRAKAKGRNCVVSDETVDQ